LIVLKEFWHYFFGVMDSSDKKGFKKYIVVLLFASTFAVLGIGAVIPLINILIQPDKVMSFHLFQSWNYSYVVIFLTCILILAFLLKNIAALVLTSIQSNFLFGLMAKIQHKLFSSYMAASYESHLNRSTPDLVKNINNETSILSDFVVAPFGTFLSEFVASSFVFLFLLMINPIFTLIVGVGLCLGVYGFMRVLKKRMAHYSVLRAQSWSSMTNSVLAGLSGIKEIKLYHCESYFLNAFKKSSCDLKHASAFQLVFQQAPRMLIEFIGLTVVMSVLCGFILVGSNPQELFVLLGVFGVAAAQLLPGLNRLTQSVVQIKYGMPALITVYNELNKVEPLQLKYMLSKERCNKLNFNAKIELRDISYQYSDGTVALKNVNVNIIKGKKIAFVGASGAGKTTVVDLLIGLYSPTAGNLVLDGKKLQTEEEFLSFQKIFSYIPQIIVLYDRTIKENVALGIPVEDIDETRIWACLKMAQLDDFVKGLKEKECTEIGEGGVRISGGQRQRIGIARALYMQPDILVMDEATSALDNQTEKEVTQVFQKLNDLTLVTIAHRLSTVKDYDVIYFMQEGRVIASGTYDQLFDSCLEFRLMVKGAEKKDSKVVVNMN